MKTISLPAYITGAPLVPTDFGSDSIILEDESVEYMLGAAAAERDPTSIRAFHGNFLLPQYRRLVKGMVASLCGPGKHKLSFAISAPIPSIDGFRKEPGTTELAQVQLEALTKSLSEIKFRRGSTTSPQQICSVELTKTAVFYETQAVKSSIPDALKTFALWQGGHGDLQQIVFVGGKAKHDTHLHAKGLVGALEIFARLAKHSTSDASIGWIQNRLAKPGGMNGAEYSEKEIEEFKIKSLREYFGTLVTKLLNANLTYETQVKHLILSGGMAKDALAVKILRDEIGARYTVHTIDNLPIKDDRTKDASFTCVNGMIQAYDIALDVGNSFLKGAINA
jgi:hypothetical protein